MAVTAKELPPQGTIQRLTSDLEVRSFARALGKAATDRNKPLHDHLAKLANEVPYELVLSKGDALENWFSRAKRMYCKRPRWRSSPRTHH